MAAGPAAGEGAVIRAAVWLLRASVLTRECGCVAEEPSKGAARRHAHPSASTGGWRACACLAGDPPKRVVHRADQLEVPRIVRAWGRRPQAARDGEHREAHQRGARHAKTKLGGRKAGRGSRVDCHAPSNSLKLRLGAHVCIRSASPVSSVGRAQDS